MMGHNICFKGKVWKIIPKLFPQPFLMWSIVILIKNAFQSVAHSNIYIQYGFYIQDGFAFQKCQKLKNTLSVLEYKNK